MQNIKSINKNSEQGKLPKIRLPYNNEKYVALLDIINKENLSTVCQ